jgi:serine/threonine protein kinase
MRVRLQLGQEWVLGERIGGGGFGQVYAAKSDDREAVAKLVPKDPGAERELLFVDLTDAPNVVPIIDRGETEDHWVLIMPRAEKSLRQHRAGTDGPLEIAEAVNILEDIAEALVGLDGRVVHRDVKPENVLYMDGHW